MNLSYQERKLIEIYRKLSDLDKENLYQIALTILNESQPNSRHEKRLTRRIVSSKSMIGRRNSFLSTLQIH